MIALHSDARANAMVPNGTTDDGETCWRDDSEPGFTILVRDQASPPGAVDRVALARRLAESMTQAGFLPWTGSYGTLYDADATPGVWLDRRGLYMLRKATVPAVIIETHNAKDGRETLRWEEEATQDAFNRAVLDGLIRWYKNRGTES
jgi:N-acetylmuramoyl-L-alanine amidase